MTSIAAIEGFLDVPTPEQWIEDALDNVELLLIDHANCEKKAASTALRLMYDYTGHYPLLHKLSRLAREELRHFEQVIGRMEKRGIAYRRISPARYAGRLHAETRRGDPDKLVDLLIVGAIIEARSCERFARLAPRLDGDLQTFYESLLASEARHFRDYLDLARSVADADIESRVAEFLALERNLVIEPDCEFRFHSGPLEHTSQAA